MCFSTAFLGTTMRITHLPFLILSLFGCNLIRIKVVDENNAPLAGAEITNLAPSFESKHNLTDSNGIASVPQVIGGNMLHIKLVGYETAFISTSTKFPTSVTLISTDKGSRS